MRARMEDFSFEWSPLDEGDTGKGLDNRGTDQMAAFVPAKASF